MLDIFFLNVPMGARRCKETASFHSWSNYIQDQGYISCLWCMCVCVRAYIYEIHTFMGGGRIIDLSSHLNSEKSSKVHIKEERGISKIFWYWK